METVLSIEFTHRLKKKSLNEGQIEPHHMLSVFWRDMGVVNKRSGQPTMQLTHGALARLHQIVPDGYTPQIDLTITDDFPLAQAIVIISAIKIEQGSDV
jgi:phosphopantetheinyl transferase (holo-ACP synthase)